MKHQLTIVKSSLAAALLLFAGVAQAQNTQTVVFAEPGSTDTLMSYSRSQGRSFDVDIVYTDDLASRSVVAFNVHWDSSEVTFDGIEDFKAIANRDGAACQDSSSSVPQDVQDASSDPATSNLKIGGTKLTIAGGAGAGVDEGDADDGETITDKVVTPVWAQICGAVFADEDATAGVGPFKVATAKFTWLDTSTETETKLGLSVAHGGDFAASGGFEGTALTLTPQTFSMNVDGSVGTPDSSDGIMIARFLILRARGASITEGLTLVDPATVQANIEAGVDGALDVDESGGSPDSSDGIMIARFLILRARGASITEGLTLTDPAIVQANIEALL